MYLGYGELREISRIFDGKATVRAKKAILIEDASQLAGSGVTRVTHALSDFFHGPSGDHGNGNLAGSAFCRVLSIPLAHFRHSQVQLCTELDRLVRNERRRRSGCRLTSPVSRIVWSRKAKEFGLNCCLTHRPGQMMTPDKDSCLGVMSRGIDP